MAGIHVRFGDPPRPLPGDCQAVLQRLSDAARTMIGIEPTISLRIDPAGDELVVALCVRTGFVCARAQVLDRILGRAVATAADRITLSLPLIRSQIGSLDGPRQVSESMLNTWVIPDGLIERFSIADMDRLQDQRFLYHLTDAEALTRATIGGDGFYAYQLHGSRELRGVINTGISWLRIDDIERLAWQIAEARGTTVQFSAIRVDAAGTACGVETFSAGQRNVRTTDSLQAALHVFVSENLPILLAHAREPGRAFLLIREPGAVRVLSYPADNSQIHRDAGPLDMPAWAQPRSAVPKADRLAAILACPRCHAPLPMPPSAADAACRGCGAPYHALDRCVSFLGHLSNPVDDPHASRNEPSRQLVHDLRLYTDGLVLNAGAGDTKLVADNLINLEIVRYPNTDVVADGQSLPFRDDAFDMVFSQSVLEHVPDPFACAREIERVLKPGGTIYVDVPFIAPYHGYPSHYFNPTISGIRALFPTLQEIDLTQGPHHAPSQAAFEILLRFARLIRTDEHRSRFLRLPIGEFLDQVRTGQNPFVTRDLDPLQSFEISAGSALYARKPPRPAPPRT